MDKKLAGLLFIFFLSFTLFASVVIFDQSPISRFTRASSTTDASDTQSIALVWPLEPPADGSSESTITVFVRNANGGKVSDKVVTVRATNGTIKEASVVSDKETGKAEFHFRCAAPGKAAISVFVNATVQLKQQLGVTCVSKTP